LCRKQTLAQPFGQRVCRGKSDQIQPGSTI
jgi:hypothetical protein